ncbi:hypothetical protein glysoja_023421 [Glycine soja]|nr:hypothetical protein glysoja_023421 [Glycine soja]
MGKGQGALKMNKESHLIKKSSSVNEAHQRPPVIIYTHSPKDNGGGEEVLKPPTPPRKEEPKANEAASPEEVESSCCNCVAPLIPDYNNANNYAVFESDLNKPLLTFANPSFFSG